MSTISPFHYPCHTERKNRVFRPKNKQRHSVEAECRLFCCPILLGRCQFCSFLKLLSYRHTANLLRFLQEAFGKGTELSMAVNDLTVAPVATAFLGQFLSTDYFAASRDLLLHRQSEQLLHQIDLTGLV